MNSYGRFRLFALVFCIATFFATTAGAQQSAASTDKPRYRDASIPVEERVADLLGRMTLEEKIDQLRGGVLDGAGLIDPTGTFRPEQAKEIFRQLHEPENKLTPRQAAIFRNAVQRCMREKTRLGIPALFYGEALHGYMGNLSTSFPQALGLAATFDPELVNRVFTAAGDEAASAGVGQVFTPVLDLARDPRWGRTEETYGEDPFLASRMGVAAVTGLQGRTFFIDRHHVMATAKHFAAHGQPEGGTNTAPANFSERILRESFLVPFKAVVQEGHAGSVMASYNEIDGIPSHINHWLLDRVLRQEWGFDGYVTSDGHGLQMLTETHHIAGTTAQAAKMALVAGVDYDLSDGSVYATLYEMAKQGVVSESQIDLAVSRVLAAKFRLGLFDNPYVDPDYTEKITSGPEHRKLAQEAAEKTIVLLKNQNNLLPLSLEKIKTIAVIGPNAADVHIGGYGREPAHGVSILQGIKDRVGTKANVLYAEGCKITTAKQGWAGWYENNVKLLDAATQQASIKEAAQLARKADVVLLVVGENESTNREAWSEEHLGDRDSLDLLGAQNDLVKAVLDTGKPTIVFLINGRPLSINYIAEHAPAIVEGFYLGQEGGTAAARMLFGDVNPGGKLPITFPRSVGNIPAYYYQKPSANRTYAFSTRKPLYPFGYGLSYTAFKFDNLRVEPQQIGVGGKATVRVDVTNTGQREGDEVPQLYIHQRVASVTRPIMELKGFQRVTLKPGEKKTVEFTVTPEVLSMINADMHTVVEPGIFDLMVGPSSDQTSAVQLKVGASDEAKEVLPPPPHGSEQSVVSNFDDLTALASYGSWMAGGDAMMGGKSTASMKPVAGGANNSAGALSVTGEVFAGAQYPWGGVMFMPGNGPMDPVNLSSKTTLSFWAKGDGKTYTALIATKSSQIPQIKPFVAGAEWKQYTFAMADFQTDGHDVTALGFASGVPGKFEFQIDEVELK